LITVDVLEACTGLRHAFFTRAGGVSGGIYGSLNCGLGSDDRREAVVENRRRAAAVFDRPADALVTLHQVHGAEVVHVTAPWEPGAGPRADAMVSDRPGIVLGILTADCAPLLFADREAGVIGAAHAGWRGARDGVATATLAAMERLGARRDRVVAAVGPCIGRASYEVGPEFPASFVAQDAANAVFFEAAPRDGHFLFDLPGYLARRLAALGLAAVAVSDDDTCADPERFFSYRRSCHRGEPDYGRGLSAIMLE